MLEAGLDLGPQLLGILPDHRHRRGDGRAVEVARHEDLVADRLQASDMAIGGARNVERHLQACLHGRIMVNVEQDGFHGVSPNHDGNHRPERADRL